MADTLAQTIGIDICKNHLDVYAYPSGTAQQFPNNAKGFNTLVAWLSQQRITRIAYEATGVYHLDFEQALSDWPLVRINPLRARRFAQAIGKLAKTDRVDAAMLAQMAAMLQPPTRPLPSRIMRQLAELANARDSLVRARVALKNRARNLTLSLLKQQVKTSLLQIDRQLLAIDQQIAHLIASDVHLARRMKILSSIKGFGDITASHLLTLMPELGALENKQAAALAGLAPQTRESGQWKGKARCTGGRANVRRALYMAALVAARFNPDLKAKYQQLISKGKPAKLALTAIMRKLIVMANALLKANRVWTENSA